MRSNLRLVATIVTVPEIVLGQVYLANITGPVAGLSSACIQVLNQQISCDPFLLNVDPDRYETDELLNSVCTTACTSALEGYQRRVQGSCGTSRYDGNDGWLYLATYNPQIFLEKYRGLCLRDSQGGLCNAVIRSVFGVNLDNQVATATPVSTMFCNGCMLSSLKLKLEQPLTSDAAVATAFTSLTSQCGSSSFSVTRPMSTVTWAIRATGAPPIPAPCQGTVYTIKPGDTCQSISLARGISTTQLLSANTLPAYCHQFPTSGSLCIPSQHTCRPYKLAAGEQCRNVAARNGISWVQVVSWNLDVGRYCENIDSLSAGQFVICTSNPGGSWTHPDPGSEPTADPPKTTAVAITHSLPVATYATAPTATRSVSLPNLGYLDPFANGTRDDCFHYAVPPVSLSATNYTVTFDCDQIAALYGVTVSALTTWNPALLTMPGDNGTCQLRSSYRYCVQAEQIRSPSITPYCVRETFALPGWTCEDLVEWLNLPRARFVEWNPHVGASCQNYHSGHMYCTDVRKFRPAGQISSCNRWEMATDVNPANDPCGKIERKYGLQHARFVGWNPSVLQNCSGIVKYYDYCVGTPTFPPPSG